ncbi:DUF2336 domain-containing protein [Winogradskya consettensis]|uniref:Leucine rich repeat variant n=1 Tax=Winogradskya consettensis TaxID=113560 RepID=A0A919SEH9_9ACTN|nr:hypothetical protein [Actinoplanes consettensis]GIM70351.1 hypothetical protein Aco04nite_19790 [Actinoplanes consettensis]
MPTLDGLAGNPALPEALAHRLVAHRGGRGELAGRPDLTAALIDAIIATDDEGLLLSLARNPHVPAAVRLRLAAHPDPGVRTGLARDITRKLSPGPPPAIRNLSEASPPAIHEPPGRLPHNLDPASRELFSRLVDDPEPRVREELAKNEVMPADLRARLAHDPAPEVRAMLARWWPQAPEDVRRVLLTDPSGEVRAHACALYYARRPYPVPPADLVEALLADPLTRAGAVRHATFRAELADDPDEQVRRQVAEHPGLPPRVRARLAEDPHPAVRIGVFARADTPGPTRQAIHSWVTDRSGPIDLDLDDDALLHRVEATMAAGELEELSLPWVTADPLPHLSSPYACFRVSGSRSPELPPGAVTQLLADEQSIVRTTMARTAPHLVDIATAERIDRTFRPGKRTQWRPADLFTFPPEVLRRLASDLDPRMRCLAPRDPDLPPAVAARLAADPDIAVRREVARHPNLPVAFLITLLADEHVGEDAAANPSLPVADMTRLLDEAGL